MFDAIVRGYRSFKAERLFDCSISLLEEGYTTDAHGVYDEALRQYFKSVPNSGEPHTRDPFWLTAGWEYSGPKDNPVKILLYKWRITKATVALVSALKRLE